MARKVVNEHNNIVTSISHAYVKHFDPPANEFLLKFQFEKKVELTNSLKNSAVIQAFLLF